MLGILYDIHGNLDALEAVLASAEQEEIDRWLLGGDYGVATPWLGPVLTRLRALPNPVWIRGNGERWLREPPPDHPEVGEVYERFREFTPPEEEEWLFALPERAELDGVLYVHGSPLSDVESFDHEPREDDERLLAGVSDQTVVFGHSHLQFQRAGPQRTWLVNPGSVGSPRHGEPNAAWGLLRDGRFELRRTEYDTARAGAAFRALGGAFGEFLARRIETGSD
jgi:predicted phosphodiesterase